MKWHIYYNFPWEEKEIGEGYESMEQAARAVDDAGLKKHWVAIRSDLFGCGGCHRAVWNGTEWVNPRYGRAYWG